MLVTPLGFFCSSLSLQSMALFAPENQRQSAEELCVVSPTPRTLQTPPPPFPLLISPPPLSPPTRQARHHLTTGFVPPPPGPCSPPVVWGLHWLRWRGVKEQVKPATGSGSAAVHRANPREATGGSQTSARGHSSWFCTAATSSWCEAEDGQKASRRLSSAGGRTRKGGGRVWG